MAGPNARLDVSKAGLELIAGFEGWRADLYEDVAGHCTIGYGHLVHQGNITAADKKGPFGKGITKEQGMALLHKDAQRMVQAVRDCVTVPLSQGQFDALVSFTFNVGAGALRRSTLVKRINAGERDVAGEFLKWNKAGGKVYAGLTRRRTAEAAMFTGGAPKPVTPAKPAKPAKPAGGGGWLTRVLDKGDRGPDVAELQRRLGIDDDGVFGPLTDKAVRAFQQKNGLTVDGKVGPKTAAKI